MDPHWFQVLRWVICSRGPPIWPLTLRTNIPKIGRSKVLFNYVMWMAPTSALRSSAATMMTLSCADTPANQLWHQSKRRTKQLLTSTSTSQSSWRSRSWGMFWTQSSTRGRTIRWFRLHTRWCVNNAYGKATKNCHEQPFLDGQWWCRRCRNLRWGCHRLWRPVRHMAPLVDWRQKPFCAAPSRLRFEGPLRGSRPFSKHIGQESGETERMQAGFAGIHLLILSYTESWIQSAWFGGHLLARDTESKRGEQQLP